MRSVVVTGVSRGLGAELFAALVKRGDRVLGIGRHFTAEQRDTATAQPERVRLLTADLATPPDLRQPFADAMRGARHSVLVHNAAVVEPIGPVGTLRDADLAMTVAVNLTAPMVLTNTFLAARPSGQALTIVFISSGAARRPIRGLAGYCATKAGGEMFHHVLAAEHPDVRVVTVSPGRMDTSMQTTLRQSDFPDVGDFVRAFQRGELPDPADVARAIIDQHLTDR